MEDYILFNFHVAIESMSVGFPSRIPCLEWRRTESSNNSKTKNHQLCQLCSSNALEGYSLPTEMVAYQHSLVQAICACRSLDSDLWTGDESTYHFHNKDENSIPKVTPVLEHHHRAPGMPWKTSGTSTRQVVIHFHVGEFASEGNTQYQCWYGSQENEKCRNFHIGSRLSDMYCSSLCWVWHKWYLFDTGPGCCLKLWRLSLRHLWHDYWHAHLKRS